MDVSITVALISFAGSAIGVLAGVIGANKLTEFRLASIEKTVSELDAKIDALADFSIRLSVIETRLDELEKR